jgi:hypothetical protein
VLDNEVLPVLQFLQKMPQTKRAPSPRRRPRRASRAISVLSRRKFLALAASGLGWLVAQSLVSSIRKFRQSDDEFLDELERKGFSYFFENTDPRTGLTLDRSPINAPYAFNESPAASVSVTGFGLAAVCVAAERGWMARSAALERVRTALRFFAERAPNEHGWFYHWMNQGTGRRAGALSHSAELSEVSTIDTALLLGGILTARQYFGGDREISALADRIYARVDFPWMLETRSLLLRHGWTPESGFIPCLWDRYSEAGLLYLLAIGSTAHPIPAGSWYAWERNLNSYGPYHFIGNAPLFVHQFSHAFVDFRDTKDKNGSGIDWFENSSLATRAHRQFCIDLAARFPGFSDNIWGITSSRSAAGYTDWGGPPLDPRIDGTVVPAAPAGSLMFTPDICLPALRAMRQRYGDTICCRYGFTDSFNPNTGWVSPDVTGLNLGITLLASENLRSGKLWRWFMANPEPRRAMALAALHRNPSGKTPAIDPRAI